MPDQPLRPFSLPSPVRVGWIGTGVMGASMCGHLVTKGYPLVVYSRTQENARPLIEKGARWANSCVAVAEQTDVIFTMIGMPQDVQEVYFGNKGILQGTRPSQVLVDMTTSSPSLAREIDQTVRAKGAFAVDAPVSGGDVGARNGTLSIMVGGDADVVEALSLLFDCLGKSVVRQGNAGSGQHAKLCNQITIAGTMIGVCEGLLYGYKVGLDLQTLLQSISKGAAGCWTLDQLAPRIIERRFDPGFFVDHFVKDMGIALDEAKRAGLVLPGLALVHQLYVAVQAQGHGKSGTHALIFALEKLANVEMKPQREP